MVQVAIAASSKIAAAAGQRIAEQGGNAVDAAVAAALVSMTTEPGVVSLGAGAYFTLWAPGEEPITIDGNIAMPGAGLAPEQLGHAAREVSMGYGGGITTQIGHGTVGTPGALAACGESATRFGKLPWQALVEPAWEHARDGFPLPQASYNYLIHSAESVYGWVPDSRQALFGDGDELSKPGDTIHVPHLAESLRRIADEGIDAFYRGEIGARIVADMQEHHGMITARDLNEYRPIVRKPLDIAIKDWHIAVNPPPAIGGLSLAAMLTLMHDRPQGQWHPPDIAFAAQVQAAVLGYRRAHLDLSDDLQRDAARLLEACETHDPAALASPSTIHVSTVDASGLACSATMSSGYGAGVMPPGTGVWLNNCLGEIELNRRGLIVGPPGTRLASNMAPAVGRSGDGALLAIGSPGADRITTALMMTLINMFQLEMPLEQAVEHPRLHIEFTNNTPRLVVEPGIDVSRCVLPIRQFQSPSMFFGGVGAALLDHDGQLYAASDSRRAGGAVVAG